MPQPTPPPNGAFDPTQTFALRLRGGASGGTLLQPLAGRLEHVMSGRCADFADAAQLIVALERLAAPPGHADGGEPRR